MQLFSWSHYLAAGCWVLYRGAAGVERSLGKQGKHPQTHQEGPASHRMIPRQVPCKWNSFQSANVEMRNDCQCAGGEGDAPAEKAEAPSLSDAGRYQGNGRRRRVRSESQVLTDGTLCCWRWAGSLLKVTQQRARGAATGRPAVFSSAAWNVSARGQKVRCNCPVSPQPPAALCGTPTKVAATALEIAV